MLSIIEKQWTKKERRKHPKYHSRKIKGKEINAFPDGNSLYYPLNSYKLHATNLQHISRLSVDKCKSNMTRITSIFSKKCPLSLFLYRTMDNDIFPN